MSKTFSMEHVKLDDEDMDENKAIELEKKEKFETDGKIEQGEKSISIPLDHMDVSDHNKFELQSMIVTNLDYFIVTKEGKPCRKKEVKKQILKKINLDVKVGSLTAVLGPSGAGKTTLLNFMALRVTEGALPKGQYLVNNKPAYTSKSYRRSISYVLQEDLFLPYLTVRETLEAAAKLKLPKSMTEEQKLQRVEEVIDILGLKKCADVIVGEPGIKKGISGGEKKRLSIGVELITRPSVMFVDEPTSGLDSSIAYDVVKILRQLAIKQNVTVITTIHQPSSHIFRLFDNVLLMKDGRILSFASNDGTLEIFEKHGLECPKYTNPADHLLEVAMDKKGKNDEKLNEIRQRYEENAKIIEKKIPKHLNSYDDISFASSFSLLHKDKLDKEEKKADEIYKNNRPTWFYKYKVLLTRTFKSTLRDPQGFFTQLIMSIVMAVIMGLVFLQIGDKTQKSIQDRQGALLFVLINQGMSAIQSLVATFSQERSVFLREYLGKQYGVSPYYASKTTISLPSSILIPLFHVSIIYWMVGFQPNGVNFIKFVVVIIMMCITMGGLGLAIAAGAKDVPTGLAMVPMILLPMILLCGFFLNTDSTPPYFIWLHYISPFKYGYEILTKTEFTGLVFECTQEELVGGICPVTNGEQVLRSLGIADVNLPINWIILAIMVVVSQFIGFFVLYWRATNYAKKGKL